MRWRSAWRPTGVEASGGIARSMLAFATAIFSRRVRRAIAMLSVRSARGSPA